MHLQQRCSGQRDGCDRCKRTSSACIYSSVSKGRGAQRRKKNDRRGKSSSSSESPLAATIYEQQYDHENEMKDLRKALKTRKRISSPPRRGHDTDDVTGLFDPLKSPLEILEDNLAITDRILYDKLPDSKRQYADRPSGSATLSHSTDNGSSYFLNRAHNGHASTDLALSLCS